MASANGPSVTAGDAVAHADGLRVRRVGERLAADELAGLGQLRDDRVDLLDHRRALGPKNASRVPGLS